MQFCHIEKTYHKLLIHFQPNVRSASTPLPEKAAKKRQSKPVESESTSNGPKKNKPKRPRVNSSVSKSDDNNTDILTNLGLTNNHTSPLRRNNTLLDRPAVTAPVNIKIIAYLWVILLINVLNCFR